MAAATPPNPSLPALPDLARGEDGAVARVKGKKWVRGARPLELFVCEVPVVRVIYENSPQRRLGPATLKRKDTVYLSVYTVTCSVKTKIHRYYLSCLQKQAMAL